MEGEFEFGLLGGGDALADVYRLIVEIEEEGGRGGMGKWMKWMGIPCGPCLLRDRCAY